MPGFFPQDAIHHERTLHFLVLVLFQLAADKHFQFAEDGPAVVMPEDHTGCFFLHVVEIQLLTNLAMVTLCRLFQTLQIGCQLLFVCPCGAIDALQHLVAAVAAPVGTGDLLQFKVMAEPHVRHVRTAAHVDIFFMNIEARLIVVADVFIKNGGFVDFAARRKDVTGFLPADLFLHHIVVGLSQLMHAFFQQVDIFLGQRTIDVDIIIEAVINDRANRHFRIRPQLLDSMP